MTFSRTLVALTAGLFLAVCPHSALGTAPDIAPPAGLRTAPRSLQGGGTEFFFEDDNGNELEFVFFGSGSDAVVEVIFSDAEGSEDVSLVIDGSGEVTSFTIGEEEHEVVYEDGKIVGETTAAAESGAGRRAQEAGVDGGGTSPARELQLVCIWGSFDTCKQAFEDSCENIASFCEGIQGVLTDASEAVIALCASAAVSCAPSGIEATCDEACPMCPNGDVDCGEPHMQGLRGQRIDWNGVDGGWYSLIKDDNADLHINVRLTAPLPETWSHRQLMTSLAVMSQGHSLVIEVKNPYTIDTHGCPEGISPCLANGGLRMVVDGQEVEELLQFSRQVSVADGAISVSASNLPVECRQFGGDRVWANMYQEFLEGRRQLRGESLEDWILRFDHMAAPDWCAKYIAEKGLADLQSTHAIFKIETPTVTVRLNAGIGYQGHGELDFDGRVLPDLDFWQMDVGMKGLDIENPALSGLLGETARPVYDENGKAVMEGFGAFRGTVEDYRVSGALGTHFPLLARKEDGHQ